MGSVGVRNSLAILILPVTMAILVPVWIARGYRTPVVLPATMTGWILAVGGAAAAVLGVALATASVTRFGREGRGTPAPWDPPRELVVRGVYGYVRNPMISGVVLVLVGEALALRSIPHAVWAGGFIVVNAAYIPLVEERGLRIRFGEAYREYCRNVPRLIPRRHPWRGRPTAIR